MRLTLNLKLLRLDFDRSVAHAARWLKSQKARRLPKGHFEIYADGAYRAGFGGGYGVVILTKGRIIHQIIGHIPGIWPSQQTMTEFAAVRSGIRWCEKHGATDIKVYYDCQGIRDCATQVVHKSTRKQADLYTSYRQFMEPRVLGDSKCKVSLHKVKAHQNDLLNNQADRLAKLGLYRIQPKWLDDPAWGKPRRFLSTAEERDMTIPKLPRNLPISQSMCRRLARIVPHLLKAPLEVRYA